MIYVWQFGYLLCFELGISVIYGFDKGFSVTIWFFLSVFFLFWIFERILFSFFFATPYTLNIEQNEINEEREIEI